MTAGDLIELDARGSGDSEPEHRDRLTYRWSCTRSGLLQAAQLTASRVVIAAPTGAGQIEFSLTVTDAEGFSSEPSSVKLNIRAAGKTGLRLVPTALSTVDGTQGNGLGLGLLTTRANSLSASAMTPVLLRVAVLDGAGTDVTTACEVEWTAKAGPQPELEGSRTASPTMRPTTAGVHELECVARQLAAGSGATLVEASGLIRVAVGSQTQPLPQATAGVRASGAAKAERPLAGDGALVAAAGSIVTLDAAGSSILTSSPIELHYTWKQVAGPATFLSDFTSPICTFEAPDLRDGVEHDMLFHLTVRAEGLESEPAPVSIRVTPPSSGTFQLDLQPGLNLVALPMEPVMQDRLVRAGDLAPVTGSSFLARWTLPSSGGGAFQPFLPSEGELGFVLEGSRGYILMHQGPAASPTLQGRRWSSSARNRTVSLTPGLNLLGISQTPPANYNSANLTQLTGAAFVARLRPAPAAEGPKFDLYGPMFNLPAFPIQAGRAYLLSVPVGRTVEVPRGQ
jgi:hypothetical protein